MSQVALEGCELEFVFVVPHDHPATGAGFPLYDDVVVHERRGKTTFEEIDQDIKNVAVDELAWSLVNDEKRTISWTCLKPGVRNHRIYVFYSQVDPPVRMSPKVKRAVEELQAQTWGCGKMSALRNEIGPDLINIELVRPLGKKRAKHFFDLDEDGEVGAFEIEKDSNELAQSTSAS